MTYIFSADTDVEIIVLFSIVLTCLSLLLSISTTMVTVLRLLVEYNSHVSQVTTVQFKLSLNCEQFVKGHAFSHKIIRDCMINALRTCKQADLWTDRSDISLNVELFYIENRIDYSQEIDCYFEIVLTAYNNIQVKYNTNIPQVLQTLIKNLDDYNSAINQSFINMLRSKLQFNSHSHNGSKTQIKNRSGIKVTGLKVIHSQTRQKSGVSLRVSVKMVQPIKLELNHINSESGTPRTGATVTPGAAAIVPADDDVQEQEQEQEEGNVVNYVTKNVGEG